MKLQYLEFVDSESTRTTLATIAASITDINQQLGFDINIFILQPTEIAQQTLVTFMVERNDEAQLNLSQLHSISNKLSTFFTANQQHDSSKASPEGSEDALVINLLSKQGLLDEIKQYDDDAHKTPTPGEPSFGISPELAQTFLHQKQTALFSALPLKQFDHEKGLNTQLESQVIHTRRNKRMIDAKKELSEATPHALGNPPEPRSQKPKLNLPGDLINNSFSKEIIDANLNKGGPNTTSI